MLHESVAALAELLATRPPADGADRDRPDGAGPLPRDVLEIATLQAQAAGVSVEAYLRAAVLAYAGRPDAPAGEREGEAGDPDRPRRARDEARRVRAESQAVKAQTAQAASRAARAKTDGDGGPPPKP